MTSGLRRRAVAGVTATLTLAGAMTAATAAPSSAEEMPAVSIIFLNEADTLSTVTGGAAQGAFICANAEWVAEQAGYPFSDYAAANCVDAVVMCALDAVSKNRFLSGVRFGTDSYGCLVRES